MTDRPFIPVRIAILTVSDTRTFATDSSGAYLAGAVEQAGHLLADRAIVADGIATIRAAAEPWIARSDVDVIAVEGHPHLGLFGRRLATCRLHLDEIRHRRNRGVDRLVETAVDLERRGEAHGAHRDPARPVAGDDCWRERRRRPLEGKREIRRLGRLGARRGRLRRRALAGFCGRGHDDAEHQPRGTQDTTVQVTARFHFFGWLTFLIRPLIFLIKLWHLR